jgi:hypothetical protein
MDVKVNNSDISVFISIYRYSFNCVHFSKFIHISNSLFFLLFSEKEDLSIIEEEESLLQTLEVVNSSPINEVF